MTEPRVGDRGSSRSYFDFFRHLSTIATVVLVVVLVLYRDLYLDPVLALLSLAAFGVCALASFYGMFVAMEDAPLEKSGSLLKRLLYVAAAGLAGAVLCLIAGIAVSMF
ncbi:MAG: hypothetical protein M3341_03610 [Actinomycetota bacterium]|jgi:hypothetical protein|nr:hypothetical protein [Actinomycetota bacterium]